MLQDYYMLQNDYYLDTSEIYFMTNKRKFFKRANEGSMFDPEDLIEIFEMDLD